MRAVGYWSYEKEVPVTKEDVQRNNNNGSSKVGSATTTVCVDYDTTLAQHPELNSVLPSSSTLQVYALMATSFYCVAFFVGVIFIVILSIHSEEFDEDEQYPMRGVLITTISVGACFFTSAAVFHILPLHGLLHYYSNNNSTNIARSAIACNPIYSHCSLGPGGHMAVFAIGAAFICGIASSMQDKCRCT